MERSLPTLSLSEPSAETALETARWLRSRHLSVFRLPLGSKTPDAPWQHWTRRLPTDGELVAMFHDAPANLAITTGRVSGIVVVDADTDQATDYCLRQLPFTPWKTRTGTGVHFYFAHPGHPVANRGTKLLTFDGLLPIHIRGDGGYIVAPGSVHPSGCRYRATNGWEWPRSSLPVYDAQLLAPPPQPPGPPRNQMVVSPDPTFVLERARRYLAAIPLPEIGHGSDHAVFTAACRLVRGFDISPEDAEQLLWTWCGNREGWTRDWVAAKVASALRHGREAVGGLR